MSQESSLLQMKSWFDWRVTLIALILAAATALPSVTRNVVLRDYYFFDVTMTSSAAGTTQLFWDLGHGYDEYDSSRQPFKIEPKPVVYRYMMPMGEIKALRLDPTDGVGDFSFSHAQIVTSRGKLVKAFSPADFRAAHEIARTQIRGDTLYFSTTPNARDAVLELNLPAPVNLPLDPRVWITHGLPVALPVFFLGMLLGSPFVSARLQRWIAPIGPWMQRRPRTTIALAATLSIAVQCHPVIFLGQSFASPNNGALMLYGQQPTLPGAKELLNMNSMSSDTGALLYNHLYYPMMQRTALLKDGELPLWNRYALCGMPMFGQGQSMFGDPINIVTILANGAAWAWDVRFLIARWLFVAGLAFTVWRLTRHLGASVVVAFFSAFIGFFTFRLNHPAIFSVCYAPLILWAWTGLIYEPTLRRQTGWLIALFTANLMVMASGTVKEAYMAIVCINLTGVILLNQLPVANGRRGRVLGLATFAGVIFTLITAPGWITFLVTLRHSFTVYDNPAAIPLPLAHIIGFFDDIFYRQTVPNEYVVAPALNFVFLLGILWWLVNPRLWRSDRAGLALALGGLLPLAIAFGIIPPSLIVKIPLVANIFHVGNTFSCSLMVIAIVLAGCGFRDAFERSRDDGWNRRFVIILILVAGMLAAYFISTRNGFAKSQFFKGYMPGLLLGLVFLPLGFRWSARSGRPGPLYVAMAIGLPLLLWRHCQYGSTFFNPYAFVPGWRTDLHAQSAGVDYVDKQSHEPGRRVGWDKSLFPAYQIALNWEGLYGVDTLRNRYYHELATEFDMKRVWLWEAENKAEDAARLVPVHDMLNVDYYIADHSPSLREFAGLKLIQQLDLDIYASPTAWPRAFFTDRLASYVTTKDFAQLIYQGDGKPFAAGQKGQTDLPHLSTELSGRTVRRATDYRLTVNNTSFVVDAPGPGIAVLTEAYYEKDFQVTVDGRPADYFRVNHAFKGVVIPTAGRHEVTFAYWPLYLTFSLWLALVGVAIALVAIGFVLSRPSAASAK